MKKLALFVGLLLGTVAGVPLRAQQAPFSAARVAELMPTPGIARNSVTNLLARGDSLWVGPLLNLTTDGGATWFMPDADSLVDARNRVFSLDAEGDILWAGLGYTSEAQGDAEGVATTGGFLFSTDGGRSFTYRLPHLDAPGDSVEVYGVSTLKALPIIVPQQSPPYDIDYDPRTGDVWVAAWASGIRRSADQGRTWQRVVLPPDDRMAIHPDSSYDFELAPQRGGTGHLNHMGFSVLVDEAGTVWAGTPIGVNRSTDGGVSWRRFGAEGTPNSLTGSWVVSIEEQPVPGRNPVWMATWNAAEVGEQGQYGVTVARSGLGGDPDSVAFDQVLLGEQIYDFAFRGAGTVYAAGTNGLFISHDAGATWNVVRHFADPTQPDRRIRPDVSVYAVATTDDALWVGTSDGLFKSTDQGATWRIYRAEVPLHPETPTAAVPDVDTYAYPNPFSPQADRFIRVRYELDAPRAVQVRIFDFSMNLVRRLVDENQPEGVREATWDGTDDRGLRVANGVYLYAVEAGGETAWGKILVLE